MQKAVTFASLSSSAMQLSAQAILDSADIYMVLWPDGHVASARVEGTAIEPEDLVGKPVGQLCHPMNRTSMERLVRDACVGQATLPVEVRHAGPMPEGTTARYSACLAGDGTNIVLIGSWISRNPSVTEMSVENEIARYQAQNRQHTEARYRLLFETAPEGILFVDPATDQIEEANANAAELLDTPLHDLVGAFFSGLFEETDIRELGGAGLDPSSDHDRLFLDVTVRFSKRILRLNNRIVRTLDRPLLMIRITQTPGEGAATPSPQDAAAIELLRRSAVPVVVCDRAGIATWANGAFAGLLGGEPLIGRDVADIMGISQSLLDITLREVDLHGRALTSLGAHSGQWRELDDAHLTIVGLPKEQPAGYGFIVRMGTPGDVTDAHAAAPDDSAIAELVGQAPLKHLVRESTDVIERNCIEAALRLTGNNRAAAAQALGLSRQTLYAKMKQHNLG